MADNNSELQLKITLDDGSIVQGFLNVEKKAKESSQKIESNFSRGIGAIKDGIDEVAPAATAAGSKIVSALTSPLGLITASVLVLNRAITAAFDLTLEGEKLNKIEKQFDSLSQTFGVAGDSLKEKFIDSLGGLVDDSDAIQSLNKAFVTLGDKVTQLPEIMTVARKATNLFGGEVTQNFEAINQAIATGSTRQLRALGIIIDAEKAYDSYAKKLGVTKDVLSESGRQQAILNEVLAQSGERFKNVSVDAGGATSAYQKFKVTLNNVFDSFSQSLTTQNGFFQRFFEGFDLLIKSMTGDKGRELEKVQLKIFETKLRIDELNDALSKRANASGIQSFFALFDGNGSATAVQNSLAGAKKDLEDLTNKFNQLNKVASAREPQSTNKTTETGLTNNNSVDREKLLKETRKQELELSSFLISEEQKRTQARIQQNTLLINENTSARRKLLLLEENFNIEDKLKEDQKNQQIEAIRQKYREQNLSGSVLEKQSISAIDETFFQQKKLAEEQRALQLKEIQDQSYLDQATGLSSLAEGYVNFTQGLSEAAERFTNNTAKKFKELGATALSAFGGAVGSAFSKFGSALRSGQDAGKAFAESLGESLAQAASMFGDFFIQMGIARAASTYGLDATAYTMLAAGAALKIIAGFAGGSSTSSLSTEAGGGGISSSPSPTTDLAPETQLERQKPQTVINYTVQGSVFDSKEAGARFIDLVNEVAGDGYIINQGAFA
jgi:hypothetical protein